MRLPSIRCTVRWVMFGAAIFWADLAAINRVATTRARVGLTIGGGSRTRMVFGYQKHDGSAGTIIQNLDTGKTISHTVSRPATVMGLFRVWWPAVAAGCLTLLALAVTRTRMGRWFIAEMPLPPMSTRWWLVTVAFIAIESGLIIERLRSSGVDPMSAPWASISLGLIVLHALAFLPVGVVLSYRLVMGPHPWDADSTVTPDL